MKIVADIIQKEDKVKRCFKPSEIYSKDNSQRYYMVVECFRDTFNLIDLEKGNTLFQQNIDYDRMNHILNSYTSNYELVQDCEIAIKGTVYKG